MYLISAHCMDAYVSTWLKYEDTILHEFNIIENEKVTEIDNKINKIFLSLLIVSLFYPIFSIIITSFAMMYVLIKYDVYVYKGVT